MVKRGGERRLGIPEGEWNSEPKCSSPRSHDQSRSAQLRLGLAGLTAPMNIREGVWRAHGDREMGGGLCCLGLVVGLEGERWALPCGPDILMWIICNGLCCLEK